MLAELGKKLIHCNCQRVSVPSGLLLESNFDVTCFLIFTFRCVNFAMFRKIHDEHFLCDRHLTMFMLVLVLSPLNLIPWVMPKFRE